MTNRQILIKTVGWRVIATLITFCTAWLITGSWEIGTAVSSADFILKFVGYFVYEKHWDKHKESTS
jgi:uncharacterized membrane protein